MWEDIYTEQYVYFGCFIVGSVFLIGILHTLENTINNMLRVLEELSSTVDYLSEDTHQCVNRMILLQAGLNMLQTDVRWLAENDVRSRERDRELSRATYIPRPPENWVGTGQ
jgi:hypothetical protein